MVRWEKAHTPLGVLPGGELWDTISDPCGLDDECKQKARRQWRAS